MVKKRLVSGEVRLPAGVPSESACMVVRVEDVSRADAPSIVVGEQRVPSVRLESGAVLPFIVEIPTERIDPRGSYSVSVHFDRSGSGEVEKGDLVSMQSYPVLTHGHGEQATVNVRMV